MCELGELDLVICSETVELVSLASLAKIAYDGKKTCTMVQKYSNRQIVHGIDISLNDYYHQEKNGGSGKNTFIPHYVGEIGRAHV